MRIGEVLPIAEYWRDRRFKKKRADFSHQLGMLGDNIYEPLTDGTFRQHRSRHSTSNPAFRPGDPHRYTDVENEATKTRDLSGRRVLVATDFVYFGSNNAAELPEGLRKEMAVGRGHKSTFSQQVLDDWESFVATLPRGVCGDNTQGECGLCDARSVERTQSKVTKMARSDYTCK